MRRSSTLLLLFLLGACAGGSGDELSEESIRLNTLGTARLSQQKWGEAIAEFDRALALRPNDPVPLTNKAIALMQQAKEEEAEALLERALAADPDNLTTHYSLALIARNRGDIETAVTHFRKVHEADPGEVFAAYNLASSLARSGRNEEAEALFRQVLERDPTHVSTLYGLGRLLMQAGDQDEGRELITRSQEIRARSGVGEAVGNQYGEQGPYGLAANYPGGGLAAPQAIAFGFREQAPQADVGRGEAVAWMLVPLDESGPPLPVKAEADQLYVAWGPRAGEPLGPPVPAGTIVGVVAGDIDKDQEVETIVLQPSGLAVLDGDAWRRQPIAGGSASLVDSDHDSDLDLVVCVANGACTIHDNDGSGVFDTDGVALTRVSGAALTAFTDFDDDRDIDLVVADERLRLFGNVRDGSFEEIVAAEGGTGPVAIADLDKDGAMDLVRGTTVRWNRRGTFEESQALVGEGAGAPIAADLDNDGFVDLVAGGRVHRNLGNRSFEPLDLAVDGAVAAADLDGDGDLDLWTERGTALINDGGDANNALSIRPHGERDNTFGIGTKVEVLAGALRQKFEVTVPLPIHMGLGKRDRADAVRLIWPGGVLQDEVDLAAAEPAEIAQVDRKGTSCPLLYAWRDGSWAFVTDFLGGCAIGYRHSPTALSTPDTDEYVLIEGGLTEEDGKLKIRLNNQLEEVIWFDQAQLVAVDHPQGTLLYPNEKLMPGPPFTPYGLFASDDVRPLAWAVSNVGDVIVTEELAARDRDYVADFKLLPYKGYAYLHSVDLHLGEQLPAGERIVLLLDGWIDYADSSANIAASQAGVALVPPRLLVTDRHGQWHDRSDRMGFPAGLPKTMAVELTDVLDLERPVVRIETNMRIYWDRARVMVGGADTPLTVRRLDASSAELRFGGFPVETSPDGKPPFAYDPSRIELQSDWEVHEGVYTAFGDVRDLLEGIDDRLVTTRSGDEIELTFDAPEPPAEGLVRSYLLYADGFGKDMDPNSAANAEVGPIPFHGMPTYPYGDDVVPPHPPAGGRLVRGDGAVRLIDRR